MCIILIVVMVSPAIHMSKPTVHSKCMYFIVYQLYLIKVVLKVTEKEIRLPTSKK